MHVRCTYGCMYVQYKTTGWVDLKEGGGGGRRRRVGGCLGQFGRGVGRR